MRVVVALGGSAILRHGVRADPESLRRGLQGAVTALAAIAREHQLVVTHGNGPQVGLLALQAQRREEPPVPLDVLGAEAEGEIGYLIDQGLANELPGTRVATLLTQVVVDPGDPAFGHPTKPIGPWHDEVTAAILARDRGWTFDCSAGACRRVVASPEPQRIIEIQTIRLLTELGVVTVCAGGGGIPVRIDADGSIHGVEAVVDKDLSSALLAVQLEADALLLLTDVDGVEVGHGSPEARLLGKASPEDLRGLTLPDGSMGPKAEAAARFAEQTGAPAVIAPLDFAVEALAGNAGTRVVAAQRAVGAAS